MTARLPGRPQIALGGERDRLIKFARMDPVAKAEESRSTSAWRRTAAVTLAIAALTLAARGQQPIVAPAPLPENNVAASLAGLLDIQADNLSYDATRRLVIARGNVQVVRGTDSVRADYAEVDTAKEEVHALGNILIQYQGNTWKGEEASYNFKTGGLHTSKTRLS